MYTVITYQEFLTILYIQGIFDRCITDQRVRWPYAALVSLTRPVYQTGVWLQ